MQADTIIAIFANHGTAELAVEKLTQAGFDIDNLSVVVKSFDTKRKVVGFYGTDGRTEVMEPRSVFWEGLWSLFFGTSPTTMPVVGPVIVFGHLATVVTPAVESSIMVCGLTSLGAALSRIGLSAALVARYETALNVDGFLVMAHGSEMEAARARIVLNSLRPSNIDMHAGTGMAAFAGQILHTRKSVEPASSGNMGLH